MVISGSGPNLQYELSAPSTNMVFSIPIWSIIAIAIGIAVIWALTVHGRDIVY